MAVEPKRGCGYRQAGGLYLVTTGLGEPCERLPVPLEVCHHCGEGIKQTRAFRWMTLEVILSAARPCAMSADEARRPAKFDRDHCPRCIICTPGILEATSDPKDKVGLIWIGEKFYPTPAAWGQEASKMGVSRRIAGIPKGMVIGKTWIMVAHPKAIRIPKAGSDPGELFDDDKVDFKPGVFHAFRPQRLELVVTPSMEKEDWVKTLVDKQGVTLVRVPENDPDHAPRQSKKSARKASMDRAAQKAAKAQQKKKPGQEPPLRRAQ